MVAPDRAEATRLLVGFRAGEAGTAERLMPLVYAELRALAAGYLRRERSGHTLQPTALVHEAFLRLVDATALDAKDQTHFVALAANTMRRILVEHARARAAEKRGGRGERTHLETACALSDGPDLDLLALDEALEKLASLDPRQARVVELRFFGGLTVEEVAELTGAARRTIELDWTLARAFLRRELEHGP